MLPTSNMRIIVVPSEGFALLVDVAKHLLLPPELEDFVVK
jgi:hypothetical protein